MKYWDDALESLFINGKSWAQTSLKGQYENKLSDWSINRNFRWYSIVGNGCTMADNSTPSRHEKSLGLLTSKFVSLLQEAQDGVLDLKLVRTYMSNFGLLHVIYH